MYKGDHPEHLCNDMMSVNSVILLDLPPKTFVGINLTSFNSSPNFHGVINLPSGYHLLYTGTDASLSIRSGRWIQFKPQTTQAQTHVLRWNSENEALDLLGPSTDAARAATGSISTLRGRGLVDYPALLEASSGLQESENNKANHSEDTKKIDSNIWPSLTSHITSTTLNRILLSTPTEKTAPSPPSWTISSISSAPQDNENIPGLDANESNPVLHESGASNLNFVPINLKQTWPDDSVGRDRTDKARDKSWYLGFLISTLGATTSTEAGPKADQDERQRGAKELLGELQVCFLMVLTLANYSALEQWKRILSVVFGCKSALDDVQAYFVEVIKVVRAQLERVEDVDGGLFEMGDEVSSQWLRQLLKGFQSNVEEALKDEDSHNPLKRGLRDLEEWLHDKYGWADQEAILKRGMVELEDGEQVELQLDGLDEEEESGEYAPVVVEM